ncbi:hypothetical protein DUI87_05670 [Hirundo rustica rustica]|uniref:Uncharacterized protein n=1 Tax=Hirundo rustica rustica TaxID=333673 RepID=A0A3M0KVB4_HIRRU|nr:hypothetical protein DUI87_05670 [Hirundo rustica rustica]
MATPTTALGILFQYVTTLSIKEFFLISNSSLPWCCLTPFRLILSLVTGLGSETQDFRDFTLLNSVPASSEFPIPNVGEEEAKKPYKYDCLYSENEKPVSEIELKDKCHLISLFIESNSKCLIGLKAAEDNHRLIADTEWFGLEGAIKIAQF